ncbi:MAG: M28 family peptidase [Cryomorphaceae bacterium]|nr:M28 family peptidase [Cryomorphaceae bacterium]
MKRFFPIVISFFAIGAFAQDGAETCVPLDSSMIFRFSEDIRFLASPDLEGRAPGSNGAELTANYIIEKLDALGIRPYGDYGDWHQRFTMPKPVEVSETSHLKFGDFNPKLGKAFFATEFSNNETLKMRTRFIGNGIHAPELDHSDYNWRRKRLKKRIAVIDLSYPDAPSPYIPIVEYINVRDRVQKAIEHGAKGVILMNPSLMGPEPAKEYDELDTLGVPVAFLRNPKMTKKLKRWWGKKVSLKIEQSTSSTMGENIIGFIDNSAPYTIILSANYDGLGKGNRASNAPGNKQIHPSADHNASGVLMVLELAKKLANSKDYKQFNYQFVFFTGTYPERYGSKFFAEKTIDSGLEYAFQINFDAVGRMGDGRQLLIEGTGSSDFLHYFQKDMSCNGIIPTATPTTSKAGAHTDLYQSKIPGIRVTTKLHQDSYKPSDDASRIQINGMMDIASLMLTYLKYLPEGEHVVYDESFEGAPKTDNDHLRIKPGIVVDYSHVGKGIKVQLTKPDMPAFKGGLHAGDIITHIDGYEIQNKYHYMDYITFLKPGSRVVFRYQRDGRPGNAIIDL